MQSRNYLEKAVLWCILYRCINNYEQSHLYLKETIEMKEKKNIWFGAFMEKYNLLVKKKNIFLCSRRFIKL